MRPIASIVVAYSMLLSECIIAQSSSLNQNNAFLASPNDHVGLGWDVLTFNSTGSDNCATGYRAMRNNAMGWENVAQGASCLFNNCSAFISPASTKGFHNVGVGAYALFTTDPGVELTAIGHSALYSNTTGTGNVAVGYQALYSNTTGSRNTAGGYQALKSNNTGSDNTAAGPFALYSNQNGVQNSALGNRALYSNVTGSWNTAMGHEALFSANSNYNTAVGNHALYNTLTWGNTAIGKNALVAGTTHYYNVAVGSEALSALVNGYENYAVGYHALKGLGSTVITIGIGAFALSANVSSPNNGNIGIGGYAGCAGTSGKYNTAIGYSSLNTNTYGDFCAALGAYATVNGNYTESYALGAYAICNSSYKARFGDVNCVQTNCNGNPQYTSDGRFKTNVRAEDVKGLEFIMRLRPVNYSFNRAKYIDVQTANMPEAIAKVYKSKVKVDKLRHTGFIAQEVEAAAREVGYEFSGVLITENGDYSLAYAMFVVPLVKAVQEQQKRIGDLQRSTENMVAILETHSASTASVLSMPEQFAIAVENVEGVTTLMVKNNNKSGHESIRFQFCSEDGKLIKSLTRDLLDEVRIDLRKEGIQDNSFILVLSINGQILSVHNIYQD